MSTRDKRPENASLAPAWSVVSPKACSSADTEELITKVTASVHRIADLAGNLGRTNRLRVEGGSKQVTVEVKQQRGERSVYAKNSQRFRYAQAPAEAQVGKSQEEPRIGSPSKGSGPG
jgi:hypothetical protein